MSPLAQTELRTLLRQASALHDYDTPPRLGETESAAETLSSAETPAASGGGSLAGKRPGGSTSREVDVIDWITRRYLERKAGFEELVLTLYSARISLARALHTAEAFWGPDAGVTTIIDHAREVHRRMHAWQTSPLASAQPYVFLHSHAVAPASLRRQHVGRLYVATGVSQAGWRELLAISLTSEAPARAWTKLLGDLRNRGLRGTRLFIGENSRELAQHAQQAFPDARYLGNFAQLREELVRATPISHYSQVENLLATIEAAESAHAADAAFRELATFLQDLGVDPAAAIVRDSQPLQMPLWDFPAPHWPRLREYRPFRREMTDFREWYRIAGGGVDDEALGAIAAAQARYAARSWTHRKYLSFPEA